MFKKVLNMLTYAPPMFNLRLNENTNPADLDSELKEFVSQDKQYFLHYYRILQFFRIELLYPEILDNTKTGDIIFTYFNMMNTIVSERNDKFVDCSNDTNIDGTYDEYVHNYSNDLFKFFDYMDEILKDEKVIDYIQEGMIFCEDNYFRPDTLSFNMASMVLDLNNINLENAIAIIKTTFFARDYFNVKGITKIRNYLLSTNDFKNKFKHCKYKEYDFENCFMLFASDYPLMGDNICFEKEFIDITIENDDLLTRFNSILYLIYLRYLYNVAIFICKILPHIFYSEEALEIIFSKVYHRLSFFIFNSLYNYLIEKERIYYLVSMIVDDCVLHHQSSLAFYNMEKMFRLSSKLYRKFNSYKNDGVINEICDSSLIKWKSGCNIDHIDMIELYKNNKKYSGYFNDKKFYNRLIFKIKEVCKNNNIRMIRGVDVFKRSSKR